MVKRHIIISGTGRAGTTFLVQLLTQLGLDTGYSSPTEDIHANCHAGMELDIWSPNAPYIVKSPALCDALDDLCQSGRIIVDHLIVPVRDLHSAAQSRITVQQASDPTFRADTCVPGGFWDVKDPRSQRTVLAEKLFALIYAAAKHSIPLTLLHFPRLTMDGPYLHGKLKRAFPHLLEGRFLEAFRAVRRPELVHDFSASGTKKSA